MQGLFVIVAISNNIYLKLTIHRYRDSARQNSHNEAKLAFKSSTQYLSKYKNSPCGLRQVKAASKLLNRSSDGMIANEARGQFTSKGEEVSIQGMEMHNSKTRIKEIRPRISSNPYNAIGQYS